MGPGFKYLFMDPTGCMRSTATREILSHCCCYRLCHCYLWRVGFFYRFTSKSLYLRSATVHIVVFHINLLVLTCRCGEDDRPLNELLVLELGTEQSNDCYDVPICKIFGSPLNHERRRFSRGADFNTVQNLF